MRSSLGASLAEGVAAEVVGACGGTTALLAWALQLGCSGATLALLASLPYAAQALQLPGAFLTARHGGRRVALWTLFACRLCLVPLALLPLWPLDAGRARLLLCACAVGFHGTGILCSNAWTAWMGDLVPPRLRGRYFGRRTAVVTLANAAATLAVGLTLDRTPAGAARGRCLAALAALGVLAGLVSQLWMSRQMEGRAHSQARPQPAAGADGSVFRRLVFFQVAWNAALGLAAPLCYVYLAQSLRLPFTLIALYGAATSVARGAVSSAWGRAVDRLGQRAILGACAAGLAASPLLFLAARPGRLWPLGLEALLAGGLGSGLSVAAFTLPLRLAGREERPFLCGRVAAGGGLAYACAALLGSSWWVHPAAPLAFADPLRLALAVSATARLATGIAAVRLLPAAPGRRAPLLRETARGFLRLLPDALRL
ncbi:MAG TPA: MFS transporter [Myxococcales bacterium]|nr:MFS transporter [Myxococcales bacterium]